MECGFLLNVVVAKSTAVLELLAGEDQALLVGRDPELIVNDDYNKDILKLTLPCPGSWP